MVHIGNIRDITDKRKIMITVGKPSNSIEWIPELGPKDWAWVNAHKNAHNDPETLQILNQQYIDRLENNFDFIKPLINELDNILFCCYCPMSNQFCHLKVFKKWLERKIYDNKNNTEMDQGS